MTSSPSAPNPLWIVSLCLYLGGCLMGYERLPLSEEAQPGADRSTGAGRGDGGQTGETSGGGDSLDGGNGAGDNGGSDVNGAGNDASGDNGASNDGDSNGGDSGVAVDAGDVVPQPAPGPRADYRFDGNVEDMSGNGLDGAIVGSVSFVEGPSDQAVRFDGVSSYVAVDPLAAVFRALIDDYSIALRVRVLEYPSGDQESVLFSVGEDGEQMAQNATRLSIRSGRVTFKTETGEGDDHVVDLGPAIPVDTWVHLAITVSDTRLRYYRDGVLQLETNHVPADTRTEQAQVGGWPGDDISLNGDVDLAQLYSGELNAGQVLELATEP